MSNNKSLWEAIRDDFYDHPIELSLLLLAGIIAYGAFNTGKIALDKNTESNLTVSRSQLYGNDNDVEKEEFDNASSTLWSLYTKPTTTVPADYCRQLIGSIAKNDESWIKITSAGDLYARINAPDFFDSKDKKEIDVVEMRRMFAHITLILGELHSAYDYWGDDVIKKEELETWLGYLREMGPHPVLLAAIWNWKKQHYMSQNFAGMLQKEFTRNATDRKIVDYFYPEMDSPDFLASLPSYGKNWDGEELGQRNKPSAAEHHVRDWLVLFIAFLAITQVYGIVLQRRSNQMLSELLSRGKSVGHNLSPSTPIEAAAQKPEPTN